MQANKTNNTSKQTIQTPMNALIFLRFWGPFRWHLFPFFLFLLCIFLIFSFADSLQYICRCLLRFPWRRCGVCCVCYNCFVFGRRIWWRGCLMRGNCLSHCLLHHGRHGVRQIIVQKFTKNTNIVCHCCCRLCWRVVLWFLCLHISVFYWPFPFPYPVGQFCF